MKTFAIQMIILIILIFIATYFVFNKSSFEQFQFGSTPLVKLKINDTLLNIEIADSKSKRAKGLSNRDFLATDSGMLFIFEESAKHRFWMKGMRIPLDIIWLRDKRVVELLKNIPPPLSGQIDSELTIYTPTQEIDSVLEVNSGIIDEKKIKTGDTIELFSSED